MKKHFSAQRTSGLLSCFPSGSPERRTGRLSRQPPALLFPDALVSGCHRSSVSDGCGSAWCWQITMGKCYDSLSPDLVSWLAQQKIFSVATAPLLADGHVNCSPKG